MRYSSRKIHNDIQEFQKLHCRYGLYDERRGPGVGSDFDCEGYRVNFAKNGNPNGPDLPIWPDFDEKEQKTMFFDKTPSARPHPNLDQLKAFDAYYAKLREEAKREK